MEKIYMEESKKQKNSLFNFSVVLSFVVAIIGIFSIGLFGIVTSQKNGLISYAAPLTSDTFNFVKGENGTGVITSFTSSGQTGPFNVEKFYADTAKTISIFCVEHMADTQIDTNILESHFYSLFSVPCLSPSLRDVLYWDNKADS